MDNSGTKRVGQSFSVEEARTLDQIFRILRRGGDINVIRRSRVFSALEKKAQVMSAAAERIEIERTLGRPVDRPVTDES